MFFRSRNALWYWNWSCPKRRVVMRTLFQYMVKNCSVVFLWVSPTSPTPPAPLLVADLRDDRCPPSKMESFDGDRFLITGAASATGNDADPVMATFHQRAKFHFLEMLLSVSKLVCACNPQSAPVASMKTGSAKTTSKKTKHCDCRNLSNFAIWCSFSNIFGTYWVPDYLTECPEFYRCWYVFCAIQVNPSVAF